MFKSAKSRILSAKINTRKDITKFNKARRLKSAVSVTVKLFIKCSFLGFRNTWNF